MSACVCGLGSADECVCARVGADRGVWRSACVRVGECG